MKILFSSAYNLLDVGSGAAVSTRETLLELARRGHKVGALYGPFFDDPTLNEKDFCQTLARKNIAPDVKNMTASVEGKRLHFRMFCFDDSGIETTAVFPALEPGRQKDGSSSAFDTLFTRIICDCLKKFQPNVYASYGGSEKLLAAAYAAKRDGVKTVFMLHNLNYRRRDTFRYFDEVVTPSEFARNFYLDRLGLKTSVLAPLINPQHVLVKENTKRFVTFVNPSPEKGLYFFIGLALALNKKRPDVLFQIVEGRGKLDRVAAVPEAKSLTNLYALKRVDQPSIFLKETRILLVPSLCEESFGRVAVEAGMNRIPVLSSNRGALPEVVGAPDAIISIPPYYAQSQRTLPTDEDLAPWVAATVKLWDDAEYASRLGARLKREFSRYSHRVVADATETFFLGCASKRL